MIDALIWLVVTFGLIALGFFVGKARERRHFAELDRREEATADVVVVDVKSVPGAPANDARLVMGEAVVAADYWKTFAAGIRNLFGGEVRSYNSMLERGRREARLRMVEEAQAMGSSLIVNARYVTSNIGPSLPSAEVFCYGTAVLPGRL
jgi:uncharacterized protein YbjQ (UPF0145 family)